MTSNSSSQNDLDRVIKLLEDRWDEIQRRLSTMLNKRHHFDRTLMEERQLEVGYLIDEVKALKEKDGEDTGILS